MSTNYILMVLYDIPNNSKDERKEYIKFRKKLIYTGFYQLQESVYIKRYNNKQKIKRILNELEILAPINSNIRVLTLTDSTFDKIHIVSGSLSFNEKIVSKSIKIIEI